ncbi:MAG: Fic family protein [Chloroflexi bacterium]|nr:Fic family protein [Chloroflexota bacterium]
MSKDGRGRPSRLSIYRAVDDGIAELQGIGGLPGPAVASELWRDIWYEETHNSTAIEGNTLILKQVRMLLEEGRAVGDRELREYLEVKGYADAADWVYAQANDLDAEREEPYLLLSELREIHSRVVASVWDVAPPVNFLPGEGPGSFRLHDILPFTSGMTPAPFTDIHPRITDWLRVANAEPPPGVHLMEHIARIHAEFERIHPFRDGNGRTGRLAMNLILVRRGYAPAIIYKRDRPRYLRALERTDRGEFGPLAEITARAVKDSLDRFLLPALAGPHQMLPISALARKNLTTLALRRAAEKGRLQAQRRATGWYSTKIWVDQYARSRRSRGAR